MVLLRTLLSAGLDIVFARRMLGFHFYLRSGDLQGIVSAEVKAMPLLVLRLESRTGSVQLATVLSILNTAF